MWPVRIHPACRTRFASFWARHVENLAQGRRRGLSNQGFRGHPVSEQNLTTPFAAREASL